MPHPLFGRSGDNLTVSVPITVAEAALGGEIDVPTLDGQRVTLRLKPGTQTGSRHRVHGKGIETTKHTGDLIVTVNVHIPTDLTDARARGDRAARCGDYGEPEEFTVMSTPENERSHTRAVYVISVAAELAGMHPQTLRIYERRGLVSPARTEGGNRRYSDADIAILKRISELTDEGMNLEGIRRVMHLEIENARLRTELDQAREIAKHAIAAAEGRRSGGDLVPLRQAVAVFGQRPSIFDD